MTLKDRITEDMKSAMKARETERLSTIRMLLAAIKQREVDERIELMSQAIPTGILRVNATTSSANSPYCGLRPVTSVVLQPPLFSRMKTVRSGTPTRRTARIAVGAALFTCGLIGGELTSASLNPARSFGPALVSGNFTDLWVFVAGPFLGASLGLSVVTLVRPKANVDEREAAEGKSEDEEASPA